MNASQPSATPTGASGSEARRWTAARSAAPLLLLLGILALGCAHTSGSRGGDEEEGSSDDENADTDREARRDRDKKSEDSDKADSDKGREAGDDADSATVKVRHQELSEAIRESSDDGRPRHDPQKLRQALCEGSNRDQPKIFYHLTVSTHWHYYWICSEQRAFRVSSRRGRRALENWLQGFKKQAAMTAQECTDGSRKALTGTHESGVRAVAYCDGHIILSFPDGGESQTSFASRSSAPPAAGAPPGPAPGPGPGPGPEPGPGCPPCPAASAAPVSCPPCPTCPAQRKCAACPPCPTCPPPRACPACPPADCRAPALEAGKKAFRQGVDKACKRICDLVYKKCRSINPNTALCYQVSEFCAVECVR